MRDNSASSRQVLMAMAVLLLIFSLVSYSRRGGPVDQEHSIAKAVAKSQETTIENPAQKKAKNEAPKKEAAKKK